MLIEKCTNRGYSLCVKKEEKKYYYSYYSYPNLLDINKKYVYCYVSI